MAKQCAQQSALFQQKKKKIFAFFQFCFLWLFVLVFLGFFF